MTIKNTPPSSLTNPQEYTEDAILGGRILLRQPLEGYRTAIDPIFLAASIEAEDRETILDVGAGVGAASLCLAKRLSHCRVVGLELQRESIRFAFENIVANGLRDRVEILKGDLMHPPPRLAAGTYAHVMANPPYLESGRGMSSPHTHKSISHMEGPVSLEQWAKFCLLMVRSKGTITFIHRSDRLADILGYFQGKLGEIVVYPLWPGEGKSAKRILVRGRKSSHSPLTLSPGLVLHHNDGRYTPQAEAILRDGKALLLRG